jgi:hypothetical protein
MSTKTNERLTKNYVDEGLDKQRQYSETLFDKAEGRVKIILNDMVDKKFKEALAVIRPKVVPTLTDSVKQISLKQANEDMLKLLKVQLQKLAGTYCKYSGFKLNAASFTWSEEGVSPQVNFTVTNPPIC